MPRRTGNGRTYSEAPSPTSSSTAVTSAAAFTERSIIEILQMTSNAVENNVLYSPPGVKLENGLDDAP